MRARVTYYHQVGYYALGIRQTRQERLTLLPTYVQVLTGRSPSGTQAPAASLSAREWQALRELSFGHPDKVIARNLAMSPPTVNFHLRKLNRKLGVRKRAAAVVEARRRG